MMKVTIESHNLHKSLWWLLLSTYTPHVPQTAEYPLLPSPVITAAMPVTSTPFHHVQPPILVCG